MHEEFDDEETDSKDLSKFKVVSNKTEVDILCDSIKKDANFSRFNKLHLEKLDKVEKMGIEEAMYNMMWTLKKTPLEIIEPIPRRLITSIDQI